jgi:virulence-associated protein VagC
MLENHRTLSVMKVKVDDAGVTVPKRMLGDADEVEIHVEEGRIVIEPVRSTGAGEEPDPVLGLGQDPVSCNAPDASTNHDTYLYGT